MANHKAQRAIGDKQIRKVIVVKGKLVNFVVVNPTGDRNCPWIASTDRSLA